MHTVVLKIKDPSKKKALVDFLRNLNFVQVEELETKEKDNPESLKELIGLWKGRDIDARKLRKEAWRRKRGSV
jgi:hypothetical protein